VGKLVKILENTCEKIWLLIVEIAILRNLRYMVIQTIIYVKCCADPVRLFGYILLRLFNFCLLYLFIYFLLPYKKGCLGSRVVSVLDSSAEGPGFKSQSRRFLVTVLDRLFTSIVPLSTKQRSW